MQRRYKKIKKEYKKISNLNSYELHELLRFFIWIFFDALFSFVFILWILASWLLGSCISNHDLASFCPSLI